jgi:uncharacterized protein YicC (UPF0701 family)
VTMAQVHICIELTEQALRSFEAEARREGVTLQSLLERTVNGLLREMEGEEEAGTDHPIIAS